MKPTKARVKSFKNAINKNSTNTILIPNQSLGETLIPIGSNDLFIELPNLSNTYTYNIINTDEMTGDITLKTSGGSSLKGLMLRSNGGSLSIEPIQVGTDELTLESDVKDGCYIQTVSNGNEWFVWSVATGGTINVRTGGIITTHTPTPPVPVYADITNVTITSDVRFVGGGLEARHDLTFSGQGEPNATLTISEDGGAITPIVITIPSDGNWTVTRPTDLPNATYTFDFNPTFGNGVQNQSFIADTGPINFTVPSTFTPDPAEVVDFASGASAVKPDSTQIAVVVDSSAWNPNLVHGDTFDIIYSITDPAVNGGVTVSQTVTGTIVDDTPPAAPVISAASITNINELSANGTAEPNKTITLFQDNLPLSPTVTSNGAGNWSFGPVVLNFNSNFTLKAQASEAGVGNPNRSAFGEYSPAFNYVQPVTPTPTIGVNGEQTSVWTNTANSFTISGTTEIGATIEVLDGANPATLVSGPTVDGAGDWSATIDVANESVTSLSAKATIANHHQSAAASFQLNVDRVPPTITLTGSDQTVGLPNVGSNNDLGYNVSDLSSGVATQTSDWDNQVSTTTEGDYTVTYNATDNAGNSASPVTRNVTVTTAVIIPSITNVTPNSNGTFTVSGDVSGTYADNLTVQVTIDDSDSGSPVDVSGGSFSHTTSTKSPGTYSFKAKTINSVGDESSLTPVATDGTIAVPDTTPPVITITNDVTLADITNQNITITEGESFEFTVQATDVEDGDITGDIVSSGDTLDTDTVGTYNLTFDVSDAAGNPANTATLDVEVQALSNFIEDIDSVIRTINSNANLSLSAGEVTDSSAGKNKGLLVNLDADGVVTYGAGGEVEDLSFTLSFWMNRTHGDTGNRAIFGKGKDSGRVFGLSGNFGTNQLTHFRLLHDDGSGGMLVATALNANIPMLNNWVHFAIVAEDLGSSGVSLKSYANGILRSQVTKDAGTIILPPQTAPGVIFGAATNNQFYGKNNSVRCILDSMQLKVGTSLLSHQVQAIYNQSDREMTIDQAAAQ